VRTDIEQFAERLVACKGLLQAQKNLLAVIPESDLVHAKLQKQADLMQQNMTKSMFQEKREAIKTLQTGGDDFFRVIFATLGHCEVDTEVLNEAWKALMAWTMKMTEEDRAKLIASSINDC